jgi:hypothetical protein
MECVEMQDAAPSSVSLWNRIATEIRARLDLGQCHEIDEAMRKGPRSMSPREFVALYFGEHPAESFQGIRLPSKASHTQQKHGIRQVQNTDDVEV